MGAELIIRMNGNTTYIKDPVTFLILEIWSWKGLYFWLLVLVSRWVQRGSNNRYERQSYSQFAICKLVAGDGRPGKSSNRREMKFLITLSRGITHVYLLMDKREVENHILLLVMERTSELCPWFAKKCSNVLMQQNSAQKMTFASNCLSPCLRSTMNAFKTS